MRRWHSLRRRLLQDQIRIRRHVPFAASKVFVPLPFRSTRLLADPERTLFVPTGTMVSKIFHPNVSKQGEICVDTLKKGWTPETGISHILSVSAHEVVKPRPVSDHKLPFCRSSGACSLRRTPSRLSTRRPVSSFWRPRGLVRSLSFEKLRKSKSDKVSWFHQLQARSPFHVHPRHAQGTPSLSSL